MRQREWFARCASSLSCLLLAELECLRGAREAPMLPPVVLSERRPSSVCVAAVNPIRVHLSPATAASMNSGQKSCGSHRFG